MKVAYLFSRYPQVSHTFCDTEMLAHERAGLELEIVSIHPPHNAFRHEHARHFRAPVRHAPPLPILKALEQPDQRSGRFPAALVREHEQRFGAGFKPAERARNALWIADWLLEREVSHLHVHFANRAAHTALFVQAICGIPYSFTAHGQDFMADLGSGELLCEIGERAAFVVAVSAYSRDLLGRTCPSWPKEKIHLIHNGIDLRQFPVSQAPASGRVPRLLSVGRLVAVKGHEHLIAACARLRERGVEFECDIIGDGPARPALQRLIEAAGLSEQVRLAGRLTQAEVARYLSAADLFVLPSVVDQHGATDILPTVVLEAMATGRAVVATQVGGVSELVDEGRTGRLVPPGEAEPLAEALGELLADPARCAAMGLAGRARVEVKFRVETSAAALRALFAEHALPAPAPRSAPPSPPFAYLVPDWPPVLPGLRREIEMLRASHAGLRVFVVRVAPSYVAEPGEETLLAALEFLPDAMVLEAEWLQERSLARRIETWRGELPVTSLDYLVQARWAVSLCHLLEQAGVRHLHVAGSAALPCGWILRKLLGVTLSATVEARPVHPAPVLTQLLAVCRGGRIAPPAVPPRGFEPDKIAAPRLLGRRQPTTALVEGWGAQMRAWAEEGTAPAPARA